MIDWLSRKAAPPTPSRESEAPASAPTERASPGIAALLEGVSEDRSHAVLDLGPAAASSFRVYSRFAQRVRFADLLTDTALDEGWAQAARALPPQPERPYDLLFTWDILDRLFPEERRGMVQRLAELSAKDARLHVVVEGARKTTAHPLRFALVDVDRMRCEPVGPPRPARPPLLPAEVRDLLAPFQVIHSFTLKTGLREYVAVRGGGKRATGPFS